MNNNEFTYQQYVSNFYETTRKQDIERGMAPISEEDWTKAVENDEQMCGPIPGWD